uniref:Transmembrane protein n=1 Tax=Davidia involucrata TaxID=16924 RepID=A0A5B7CAB8_DAVIN
MESKEKVELIQLAIQKLMEEKRTSSDESSSFVADDEDHHLLLSRLLAQLETLKGDSELQQPESSADPKEIPSPAIGKVEMESETKNKVDGATTEVGRDEIVKELRKVKRQNFITHCLLSAMIVLTVVWQLSEVALILKVKNGMSHPFRSFGSMLTGIFKGPEGVNGQNGETESSTKQKQQQQQSESHSPPPLKIPELPHVDLSDLGLNWDED